LKAQNHPASTVSADHPASTVLYVLSLKAPEFERDSSVSPRIIYSHIFYLPVKEEVLEEV